MQVSIVDDEKGFQEPLSDALEFEGYKVLKATTVSDALEILKNNKIDLITIDIMLDPGESLKNKVDSHFAGIYLCEKVKEKYPKVDAFCISVVNDNTIKKRIESHGVRFLRKGETSLEKILQIIKSKLTGFAYLDKSDNCITK